VGGCDTVHRCRDADPFDVIDHRKLVDGRDARASVSGPLTNIHS
jgi:hypothetical protein